MKNGKFVWWKKKLKKRKKKNLKGRMDGLFMRQLRARSFDAKISPGRRDCGKIHWGISSHAFQQLLYFFFFFYFATW